MNEALLVCTMSAEYVSGFTERLHRLLDSAVIYHLFLLEFYETVMVRTFAKMAEIRDNT